MQGHLINQHVFTTYTPHLHTHAAPPPPCTHMPPPLHTTLPIHSLTDNSKYSEDKHSISYSFRSVDYKLHGVSCTTPTHVKHMSCTCKAYAMPNIIPTLRLILFRIYHFTHIHTVETFYVFICK